MPLTNLMLDGVNLMLLGMGTVFVFLVILGAAILVMTLFVSHLIAGPLYAVRRYIERIGEGELDFDARLRSKDQTTPLAMTLSDTIQVLNDRISSIQMRARGIRDLAGENAPSPAEDSPGEGAARDTSAILALSTKLVEEAEFFKTRTGEPRP